VRNKDTNVTREISAKDLVIELTEDTAKQDTDEEPLLPLSKARVVGKLDLKHCTIQKPLEILDCDVEADVDLRYCEFEQAVNFSGCTFHGEFNSGDEIESHTVYKKDLICNKTTFERTAWFHGVRVEGSAYFSEADFPSEEQSVNFTGGTFETSLECNKATFQGAARFIALRCNGVGIFSEARFRRGANFAYASFGAKLEFRGTQFEGPADLHLVKCRELFCCDSIFEGGVSFALLECDGSGLFNGAKFRGKEEVSFNSASFVGDQSCRGAAFEGAATFDSLKCNSLSCAGATFEGGASFTSLECSGSGQFSSAKFKGKEGVWLDGSSFGQFLYCNGTTFEGAANFHSLKCNNLMCAGATFEGGASFISLECSGSGQFNNTKFKGEKDVSFLSGSFRQLNCSDVTFEGAASFDSLTCNDLFAYDATFEGKATFGSLKCDGVGEFDKAIFEGEVLFLSASFADLFCNEVTFKGETFFSGVKCNRGSFNDAKFHGKKVDFVHASFGVNLQCKRSQFEGSASFFALNSTTLDLRRAQFVGSVNLSAAHISQNLILTDARFQRTVTLKDASIGELVLEGDVFPFKNTLDLRDCTFSRFRSPQDDRLERAMELANAQDPTKFSRDPYLQLEKYYESIGNDAQARRIYYQGRCELRVNAKAQNKWSSLKSFTDLVWKYLTGYGVDIRPLLLISSIFLIIGTLMFYLPNDALSKADASAKSYPWQDELPYRFLYSLDLLIPLINLRVDEQWMPNGLLLQAYSTVHAMVGWLIIPLLLAALAGIMRR
jgi:hypothetical protein